RSQDARRSRRPRSRGVRRDRLARQVEARRLDTAPRASVRSDLERIRAAALADLDRATDDAVLEDVRLRYLGKKGELTSVLRGMREVPEAERPAIGELVNTIKAEVEARLRAIRDRTRSERLAKSL